MVPEGFDAGSHETDALTLVIRKSGAGSANSVIARTLLGRNVDVYVTTDVPRDGRAFAGNGFANARGNGSISGWVYARSGVKNCDVFNAMGERYD